VKRVTILKGNLAAVYAVIWGQCSEAMKAKVKAHDDYQTKADGNDCLWILKQIKAITLQFDEKKNKFISLLDARTSLLNCRQYQGQSNDEYLESLRGWADTIEYHGGTVAENFMIVPETVNNVKRTEEMRKTIARDSTLAILLIRRADPTRYGTLIADLSNNYAMGKDEYPKDLSSAYSLLVNYKTPMNKRMQHDAPPATAPVNNNTITTIPEVSAKTFAQKTTQQPGANDVLHDGVTCFKCHGGGHYADECPTGETATSLMQHGYMLTQIFQNGIDADWILLDSQSTISVFRNPHMLTNIRKSERTLRALTNGGHQDSHMVGTFPNLGEVWYNENSIANILSLAAVRKVCRITMDTTEEPALNVHRLDGTIMKFVEHESGLYIYSAKNNTINNHVSAYTLISTVKKQKAMFSPREVRDADHARALYCKLGRPSEEEFQHILSGNLLRNCPVSVHDAKRALTIYGPDIATIKGSTTRSNAATRIATFEAVPLPASIREHHNNVTLCVDFFFVQGLIFMHTISRGIGFRTVSRVNDRNKPTILKEIKAVLHVYRSRGFSVCDIHADNEFACIREDIRPIQLNIIPADSHVGEVERSIRTIKERLRSCVHGLPFKRLPILLLTHMVSDVVRCLNMFPWTNGISTTLSPVSIVTGAAPPDFNTMRIEFGSYAQVFEDNLITNTPRARTLGAIALNPTGNAQGDYYFCPLPQAPVFLVTIGPKFLLPTLPLLASKLLVSSTNNPLFRHAVWLLNGVMITLSMIMNTTAILLPRLSPLLTLLFCPISFLSTPRNSLTLPLMHTLLFRHRFYLSWPKERLWHQRI
jgi:acetolactate synthase regulatory subunit